MDSVNTKLSPQFDDLLLLVGQTLSQVSDRMVQLGLIWFITSTFGEAYLIWYLVVGGLPHALMLKHSGQLISRVGALKTVLYSDFIRGIIYFFSFVLIMIFPQWLESPVGSSVLWLLFISVFLGNIFSAFFNPAIMSLSVEIKEADQIQKLTAKLSSITSLATIVGPVLGLFVFNSWGLGGLFVISACCYFVSTYAISLVTRSRSGAAEISSSSSPNAGFDIFKTHPVVPVMLIIFLLMNLMLSPIQILMPSLAKDIFGNSFNALAILETILGVGVLLGGAGLAFLSIQKKPLFWTWIFLVILSFSYQFFTVSGDISNRSFPFLGLEFRINFITAAMSLFSLGFCLGVANILIINILQTLPRAAEVPKIMGFVNLISTATLPFSLAGLGVLQQWSPISNLGTLAGFLLILISLFSFFPFRHFGREIFS